jgi:hypothetical protein
VLRTHCRCNGFSRELRLTSCLRGAARPALDGRFPASREGRDLTAFAAYCGHVLVEVSGSGAFGYLGYFRLRLWNLSSGNGGGKHRLKTMTKAERSKVAAKTAKARWKQAKRPR